MARNISIRDTEDYYPNQGSSRRRQMRTGDPVTYPNQGSSAFTSRVHGASGAWRAEDRRPNGRDLIDLTGNGRDLLMGGESSAYTDGQALVLPGLSGNYASVPDEAALDITGDIDIRADVALDDWTPGSTRTLAAKWDSGLLSYLFRLNSSNVLELFWDPSGSSATNEVSTVQPSTVVSDGGRLQIRVTLDVDNDASGHDVKFYTRAAGTDLADDTGWTQLGATVTTAGTTDIGQSSTDVRIGGRLAGETVSGSFYAAVIKDGIGGAGTTVLDVDFDDAAPGGDGTTFTATSGQTVTINGTTTTNDPRVLDYDGTRYMFVDGTSGQYASVPDSASLDIVGDIDITVDVAMEDWTPSTNSDLFNKHGFGTQGGYGLRIRTNGVVELLWSDGTSSQNAVSTVVTGLTDGTRHTIRATLDVDNGAGGYDVKFYVDGVQLGSTSTGGSTTSIAANAFDVAVGRFTTGGTEATGKFYGVVVKDGIDGTTVLDVDFTDQSASSAPYTTVTGQSLGYMTLDGTGDYASVPDSADLRITSDIDLRSDAALDNWSSFTDEQAFAARWASGALSYLFRLTTAGALQLFWYDGSSSISANSTVNPSTIVSDGDRLQIRATLDVDNDAGGYEVKFYTRASGTDLTVDTGWTQLGATVTGGSTTSISAGTAALTIGHQNTTGEDEITGQVWSTVVKNGIDGTAVLDIDFDDGTAGDSTFTCNTGQTVTLNGDAAIGGGQTVTLNGRATLVTSPRLYLDGTDDWLSVAETGGLQPGTDDLTVVAVYKHRGSASDEAVIGTRDRVTTTAADAGYTIRKVSNNNILSLIDDATNSDNSFEAQTAGKVHVVAFYRDTTNSEFVQILDGSVSSTEVLSVTGSLNSDLDITVGSESDVNGSFFSGEFFGCSVFVGRVLTAAEIAQVGRELAYREASVS